MKTLERNFVESVIFAVGLMAILFLALSFLGQHNHWDTFNPNVDGKAWVSYATESKETFVAGYIAGNNFSRDMIVTKVCDDLVANHEECLDTFKTSQLGMLLNYDKNTVDKLVKEMDEEYKDTDNLTIKASSLLLLLNARDNDQFKDPGGFGNSLRRFRKEKI